MKVALVYDRANKWGGAETVLLALHKVFPQAPLYTSVYEQKSAPWAKVFDVRTSFLQKLPLPKTAHEYYPYLMGLAFESFNFDNYDLVISVSHEFAKAVVTKPKTFHLCYCLNPVGYLWSGYHDYFAGKSDLFQVAADPLVRYLRWYDRIVAQRPDQYLAISQTVAGRIQKYYRRPSQVIYPPVTLAPQKEALQGKRGDFFLVVSRLASEKRLDIAIDAFNLLGWPLKIIGLGRDEKRLKARARSNVEFLGYLTDKERNRYYKSCQAVIIPGVEDFNIVAVEAQSFGKPVLAFRAGGVTETVSENVTGWFFDKPNGKSLATKLQTINPSDISAKACQANTAKFSEARFREQFLAYVNSQILRHR